MTKTWCAGGNHYINTNSIVQYEKLILKLKNLLKVLKAKCDICARNKSQFFTK